MNDNLNNQQPKPNPREHDAIVSFRFGIVAVIAILLTVFIGIWPDFPPGLSFDTKVSVGFFVFLILLPGSAILGLLGLILGIRGLKSPKKNLAIKGIVLCGIALISLLVIYWPR